MDYSNLVKQAQDSDGPRVAKLVELHFASGTVRVWEGFGRLVTLDDKEWMGTAELGSVSPISQSHNGTAPAVTLELSGVDATFAAKAKAEADEFYALPCVVYDQYFYDRRVKMNNPYIAAMGIMTNITSTMEGTDDGRVYTVSLTVESPFATRRRARNGYVSPRDQKKRVGEDDTGYDRLPGIDNKFIEFPVA